MKQCETHYKQIWNPEASRLIIITERLYGEVRAPSRIPWSISINWCGGDMLPLPN